MDKYNFDDFFNNDNEESESFSKKPRKVDFFDFLDDFSAGNQKHHRGVCNGDCANCPSHYGYRYGRWYYGKDHTHGCKFGGNRGGGGII